MDLPTRRRGRPTLAEAAEKRTISPLPGIPVEHENGEPFVDDPLRQILSENGARYAGETEDTLPPELAEFLVANDLGGKPFQIILKQYSIGAGEGGMGTTSYVKAYNRTVPSIEHIARNYGPGEYIFQVAWKGPREDGGQKTCTEQIPFSISDKYEAEYLEAQDERRIVAAKKRQERVRQLKTSRVLDDALFDGEGDTEKKNVDAKTEAKNYLTDVMDMAKSLGLSKQETVNPLAPLMGLLPMLVPVVTAMIENGKHAAQQQQNQTHAMMGMMLAQSEKANMQLVETMKIVQGKGSANTAIAEFKDMIFGAIDIKDALRGKEPDSMTDRVLAVIEGVLPQLLTVVSMSQAQRQMDPRFHMARAFVQNDPTFKQVMDDPIKLSEMVSKLDSHYGWEQADGILAVAGKERPSTNPRDPAMKLPANERETEEAEDATEDNGSDDAGETA
jgi:hypothetical protein